jgi:hypothetical protein
MSKICTTCSAVASPDLQLEVRSMPVRPVLFQGLSEEDWKKHKQICKFLNVGNGAMQVRTDLHIEAIYEVEGRI